jgi:type II secretory pathway component GspD/PulD (secretin)
MSKIIILIITSLFLMTDAFCQSCQPELKVFKIKHGNVETIYEVADNLKSSDGKVSFDKNSNSLIVFDCPENINRIGQVIEGVDVKERQVEIKVMVVEATSGVLEKIGITSGQVIIPEGQFRAIASLLEASKEAKVRSSMMVRTLSNRPAILQVTKEEILGTETVIFDNGTTITMPIREPIGNFLEVLPTVHDDRTIEVVLRPSVSSMERPMTPSERSVITQVVVNDGDTIAIGGADVDKSSANRGILSARSASEKKRIEMFLTAKIVE